MWPLSKQATLRDNIELRALDNNLKLTLYKSYFCEEILLHDRNASVLTLPIDRYIELKNQHKKHTFLFLTAFRSFINGLSILKTVTAKTAN